MIYLIKAMTVNLNLIRKRIDEVGVISSNQIKFKKKLTGRIKKINELINDIDKELVQVERIVINRVTTTKQELNNYGR